jgi:hypothetical protein
MNTPLRNQTTLKQEHAAYMLFTQLAKGRNVPFEHVLRDLKLNDEKSRGWSFVPELRWEFGLYDHTVKQVYNSFLRVGDSGARGAIITLAITDESLCGLIRRYASTDEMTSVWNWPLNWTACEHYKHRWCA